MSKLRIGFVGAGQMARALASGFVSAGLVAAEQIVAFDPGDKAWGEFSAALVGAKRAATNAEVVQQSEVIFLAVKPQSFAAVAPTIKPATTPQKLFVSIITGISLD
ncbi:MAG TPA: NAD(P)-binding domain-containing protein, partial [Pirellulaceae bacterium]|nr:NAD(P)-binding domain-containing protein [Pirellulaceae bacterium]